MAKCLFGLLVGASLGATIVCFVGIFAADTWLGLVKHVIATPLLLGLSCALLQTAPE